MYFNELKLLSFPFFLLFSELISSIFIECKIFYWVQYHIHMNSPLNQEQASFYIKYELFSSVYENERFLILEKYQQKISLLKSFI